MRVCFHAFRETCREELGLAPEKVTDAYLEEDKKRLLEQSLKKIEALDPDESETAVYEDALQRYGSLLGFLFQKTEGQPQ